MTRATIGLLERLNLSSQFFPFILWVNETGRVPLRYGNYGPKGPIHRRDEIPYLLVVVMKVEFRFLRQRRQDLVA